MHRDEQRRCLFADETLVLLAIFTELEPSLSKRGNLISPGTTCIFLPGNGIPARWSILLALPTSEMDLIGGTIWQALAEVVSKEFDDELIAIAKGRSKWRQLTHPIPRPPDA
jgi:hypothetical protein